MVRVGEQHHVVDAKFSKDLRTASIIAQFLDLRRSSLLALGAQLHEPGNDVFHWLVDDHNNASAFVRNGLHRAGQQARTLVFFAKHVNEHRHGVHPHQTRFFRVNSPLNQSDRLIARRLVVKGHGGPVPAPAAVELHLRTLFDQMVMLAAIGD